MTSKGICPHCGGHKDSCAKACRACDTRLRRRVASTNILMVRSNKNSVYGIWLLMVRRCHNQKCKSYPGYGGRGIYVCDRWKNNFECFASDMGPRPEGLSLDRIDNDGPYAPENCRWATRSQQQNNKTNTKRYTYGGLTMTLPEWERHLGFPAPTMRSRVRGEGWSIERAVTTPIGKSTNAKLIEFNGVTRSVRGWALALGIKSATLRHRLNRGLTPDMAFRSKDAV